MTLAWLCFAIGFTIAFLGAVRSLVRANRDTLEARDRAGLARATSVALSTVLIALFAYAFGFALIVTLGWTFGEDLSSAHPVVRGLCTLLPLLSVAQGLIELVQQTTPAASSPLTDRLRARWPAYATFNTPALVAGLARVLESQWPFGEATRGMVTDVEWGGTVAEVIGVVILGVITLKDQRAASAARDVTPPLPSVDNYPRP